MVADDFVFERLLRRSRRKLVHAAAIAHFLEDALDTIAVEADQETARRVLGVPEFVQRILMWLGRHSEMEVRFLAACLLYVLAPTEEDYAYSVSALEAREQSRRDANRSVLILLAGALRYSESLVVAVHAIARLGSYIARFECDSLLTPDVLQTLSFIFADFPRMRSSSIPTALVPHMPNDPEAEIYARTEAEKARILRLILAAWRPRGPVQ